MASKPREWTDVNPTRPIHGRRFPWLYAAGQRIWNPLVYSSAYLAFIAVAEVFAVMFLLSLPLSLAPVVAGLITFTIYANDRLVDLDSDAASNPRRTAFVRRYRKLLYVFSVLSYGLAVALAALGGPLAFGLTLLPAIVWVGYAIDWIPKPFARIRRLKEIIVVNSMLVAGTWSLTIVFLPVAYANEPLTPAVGIAFMYFLLATFANTEIANVRDIESDTASGVATLPVVLGVDRTRWALYGVTLLTAGLLGYAIIADVLTGVEAAIFAVGLVCLLGVIGEVGRVESEKLLSLAAELTRLPVFVLLAVLTVM